jgi:syntaxin-binding protein 1
VTGLAQTVEKLLQDSKISPMDKLRLIVLYIVTQDGVQDSDLDKLMSYANVSGDDRKAIVNLQRLDFQLGRGLKREKKDKKKGDRAHSCRVGLARMG